MSVDIDGKRLCDLCYMNPPHDLTEDGEVTFLPVPEALPGKDYCEDCQQQCDAWDEAIQRHAQENHQAPWEHNCEMCSMAAYEEDREKTWQEHLARCEECQTSPHDFVGAPTAPRYCRACGLKEGTLIGAPSVCTESYVREMHRDLC